MNVGQLYWFVSKAAEAWDPTMSAQEKAWLVRACGRAYRSGASIMTAWDLSVRELSFRRRKTGKPVTRVL